MKRPWAQWLFNLAVLVAIVLLLAGAGWLFAQAIESGSTFLGAVLASGATVGTVVLGRFHERRKEAEATRRRELGSLYEGMVGSVTGQPFTDRKREKMIVDFMRKTIVYASPAVIKAFRNWRDNLPEDDATPAEQRASMVRYEKLIIAMRKDLGISSWMLEEGDLLRAIVTDFDASGVELLGADEQTRAA